MMDRFTLPLRRGWLTSAESGRVRTAESCAPVVANGAGTGRPPRLPSSHEHESDRLSRWPISLFFFSREKERLHIHVQSADGEAKIWIEPEIELARNHELNDQDLNRVLQLVIEHEQEIRDAWRRHFDS
jgi:hypothetical protein